MAVLTPPGTPAASAKSTIASTRVSLIHSINYFWAKLKRSSEKKSGAGTNSPRSPTAKPKGPKQILLTLSNKAIIFKQKMKGDSDRDLDRLRRRHDQFDDENESDFGDGGLWQKSILLGDKCQPPDFSGVIYYDSCGKQLPEFPMRSPRASPLPSYLYASSEK